ncbi:carbohydrate ABC transporter permease [Pseudonocardia alaniniphila]|uniref:Sugar ABC transporter permease n=1 Tax=Pseudonocardia alaniniphila TaxID=75291 RepID=A0ABS9TEF0_9PSEU|nr:sugar ABC transporter permease [Pseudonocardia alaniniphila]MCH6166778.1 sugar ABC transporter permease [Pseudonocardia alaniniphila]
MSRSTSNVDVARPGFGWVVPALVFFALFALVPMLALIYLSFTTYDGLNPPVWVGIQNWRTLAGDQVFLDSLRLSGMLTLLSWLFQTAVALPLGVYLAGKQRTRAVLAAIFFVPQLMSGAAIAVLWGTLFDPNFGLASVLGPLVGVPDGNFIGSPSLAFYVVLFVISWQFMPFHTLFYQAAARAIPESLYEAATLDGAGRWRQFRSITVPQLRHTIITSGVHIIVGSLTYFEIVLILTNGGPGTATRILPLHMYIEGFRSFQMGYSAALAVVLLVIGTALSLVITRVTGYRRMASQREGL